MSHPHCKCFIRSYTDRMFNHKLLIKCIEHIESEPSTEHWVHKSNQNCFWTLSAIKKTARIKWFLSKQDTKELLCGSDRWNDAFTGLSKKSDIQPPRLTPSITALTSIHDLNTTQWRSLWVSFKLRLDQNHQNQLRRSVLTINRPKPLRSLCCSVQMKQEVFYSLWIWREVLNWERTVCSREDGSEPAHWGMIQLWWWQLHRTDFLRQLLPPAGRQVKCCCDTKRSQRRCCFLFLSDGGENVSGCLSVTPRK